MNRWVSGLLACALAVLLAWPAAFGAQEKLKKPAVSEGVAVLKKPVITEVRHHIYGEPPPEIDIIGSNFGSTRGTKNVRFDTTLSAGYLFWGNSTITTNPPFPLVYWDHVYQIAIVSGSNVLSNVFSKRFPWDFDGMTPREGPVGTEVVINVYRLPASPGGLVLKIGTLDFPVVEWTPAGTGSFGKIKARVPSGVPLGAQNVYLQKGGQVASEIYTFTVILPLIAPPPKIIKK
jgi:hypothetical protein